jgi:hypothetical protein
MSNKSIATVATMGIDIVKNSFHVVGLDQRGAAYCGRSGAKSLPRSRRRGLLQKFGGVTGVANQWQTPVKRQAPRRLTGVRLDPSGFDRHRRPRH